MTFPISTRAILVTKKIAERPPGLAESVHMGTGAAMIAFVVGARLAMLHPEEAQHAIAQTAGLLADGDLLDLIEHYVEYIATGQSGDPVFDYWMITPKA